MKRFIAIILILTVFAFLFAGCKGADKVDVTTVAGETTVSGTTVSGSVSGTTTTGTTIPGQTTTTGKTATTTKPPSTTKTTTTTYAPTKIKYIYAIPSLTNVSRLEVMFTRRVDVNWIQDNAKSYSQRGLKALFNGTEIRKIQYRSNGAAVVQCNMEGKNDNRTIIYLNTEAPDNIKLSDYAKLSVQVVANKIKDENGKFVPVTTRKADTNKKYDPNGTGEHHHELSPHYIAPK